MQNIWIVNNWKIVFKSNEIIPKAQFTKWYNKRRLWYTLISCFIDFTHRNINWNLVYILRYDESVFKYHISIHRLCGNSCICNTLMLQDMGRWRGYSNLESSLIIRVKNTTRLNMSYLSRLAVRSYARGILSLFILSNISSEIVW